MIFALLILVWIVIAFATAIAFSLPWTQDRIEIWLDQWNRR